MFAAMRWLAVIAGITIGCGAGTTASGPTAMLRSACGEVERWDGAACVARAPAAAAAVMATDAKILEDPAAALAMIDRNAAQGPFDRATYARLWRQRGIAHALLAYAAGVEARDDPAAAPAKKQEQAEHEAAARAAFDMLLAIDPTHRLEYTVSPQATFVFEHAIGEAARRPVAAIDVDWKRGLRVGDAIPVDVEVIADPKSFLARAVVFVRRRGDAGWRAADVDLPQAGGYRRVVLPPDVAGGARAATAVELFLRAYDADGNEVLEWASPARPREVALRWDPPTPWWRKWWVWAIAGSAVAGATGIAVYAAQWEPSDSLPANVGVETQP
jgi:hypothetical protein